MNISVEKFPKNLEEMKAMSICDLTKPENVVVMAVLSYAVYVEDKQAGIEMFNFLKGPEPLNPARISFMDDRVRSNGKLLPYSYFEGAKPENSYTPAQPITMTVTENPYSRAQYEEGYLTLFIKSGGADSERPFRLRTKKSTGEWFINEDSGMYVGIRPAVADDPWA